MTIPQDADCRPVHGHQANHAQDYITPPFLVVAVGASAGGLEAFSSLLQDIPSEAPLAMVIVQHMGRTQPSLLAEILAGRTALHVEQATDGARVEVGHVYVIPPDKHMTVIDGHLRICPRPEGPWSLQVNALFRSVAEYYRDRAVGVILSGALNDGAAGFVAISAAGGVTIAQLPEEAQTEGMPRAAIATGNVDLVLPVQAIGQELLRLAAQPRFKRQPDDKK
jgi:two-component system, chemotaxis family, CheB/CheR fusion protein